MRRNNEIYTCFLEQAVLGLLAEREANGKGDFDCFKGKNIDNSDALFSPYNVKEAIMQSQQDFEDQVKDKGATKISGKPFKSGLRQNTIKSVIVHPQTGERAFTFKEDDSYVSVCQCIVRG